MKKVTLTKSLIASKPNQRATAKSLGLNKSNFLHSSLPPIKP